MSKLIPDSCPRVNIGERIFNRIIVFFILFGQGAKNFRPFDKFFKAEFWNYMLRVHKNKLRNFLRKKTNFHHFWNLKEKNYAFFLKSIGGVVKTAFYLSTGTFGGVFLGKSTILSLWDVVGEFSDLFRKSFGGVVNFCNYVSRETIRGKKIFFLEEWFFSKQAELERKNFCIFWKTFRRICQNCIPGVQGKHWGKIYYSKYCVFHPFSTLSQKLSAFWQFFLWQSFENYILRVHKTTLRIFRKKNLIFYLFCTLGEKNLRLLPEKYRRGSQNCILSVHRSISRRLLLQKKALFYHFRTLLKICSNFCGKNSAGLSNSVITSP